MYRRNSENVVLDTSTSCGSLECSETKYRAGLDIGCERLRFSKDD